MPRCVPGVTPYFEAEQEPRTYQNLSEHSLTSASKACTAFSPARNAHLRLAVTGEIMPILYTMEIVREPTAMRPLLFW